MDGGNQSGYAAVGGPLDTAESGDSKKSQRQRHTYIIMRLAEIAERIRDFAAEREGITASLRTRPDEKGDEVRKLRQRREYLASRLSQLREEQHALNLEKKTVAPDPDRGASGPKGSKARA